MKVSVNSLPLFKTHYNAVPHKGQVFVGESMTVPDQSMTIPEILAKHRGGFLQAKFPIFDDSFAPDFDRMDPFEKKDYLLNLEERLEGLKKKISYKAKAVKDSKDKASFDAAVRAQAAKDAASKDDASKASDSASATH